MAKDPVIGPVTLYDAHGNPLPVKPDEVVVTEEPTALDEAVVATKEPTALALASLPGLETTLKALKMPDLRKMAKEVGSRPARTKVETIERIMVAFTALKEAGEKMPSMSDAAWQAPPPIDREVPGLQKSVRVRRIHEASGKKGE